MNLNSSSVISVEPSRLCGEIRIPGSKSHTIRASVLAAFSSGESVIRNPLFAADTESCFTALEKMGAVMVPIRGSANFLNVSGTDGRLKKYRHVIDLGNSGTSLRFLTAMSALSPHRYTLDGDASLRGRTMAPLLTALQELGARVASRSGRCPVRIAGPMRGGKTSIRCISSQFLSALLMAAPLIAGEGTCINVDGLNEFPYVRMTLSWLNRMGVEMECDGLKRFYVPGGQTYRSFTATIPGDFSSAAFAVCGGILCGENVHIQGLDFEDTQGDKQIFKYLEQMGAQFVYSNNLVKVRNARLTGIDIDMNSIPDALPIMSVVGCFARGTTRLYNVAHARFKECDRIASMAKELRKMGGNVQETGDGLTICESRLCGADLHGHHDHRIVMALAVAGMAASGRTRIDTASSIRVTYPGFVEDFKAAGAKIKIIQQRRNQKMIGCTYGRLFQTTVAGGSYQEGLSVTIQGIPAGYLFSEEEIYTELMLRKPGQGELTSPRREADIPLIYSGVNSADTLPGVRNAGYSNGTPLVILIPNVDRHLEHVEQYRSTNRTPRPGHASYASYKKYGLYDDAVGAGFFSGRYTATIVAAGAVAKKILADWGITVIAYIKEAAGIRMTELGFEKIRSQSLAYRKSRKDVDPVYQEIYRQQKIKPSMRFFDKIAVLHQLEKDVPRLAGIRKDPASLRRKYGVNPEIFCPDLDSADAMQEAIMRISREGDSSGGIIEVIASGLPAGVGEPVFSKLDGELAGLMNIGTVKAVEIGCGIQAATMKGSTCNDQMRVKQKRVVFTSNHAGGITGGLSTGQSIIARVTVKPTPTIAREQFTIDKISVENKTLAAVTRRDPTIVTRIWPVVEGYTALVLLDALMQHVAYQSFREKREHIRSKNEVDGNQAEN